MTEPVHVETGSAADEMFKSIAVFNRDALEIIVNTPLFNDQEKEQLQKVSSSMEKSFHNSQVFRTDTEARISVLNEVKFPTPASKYYQALREMNVHQCELVHLLYDYESKQQDLAIIEAEIMELEDKLSQPNLPKWEAIKIGANLNKKRIELRKEAFTLKNMKRVAEGRKEELLMWDKIIGELEPILVAAEIPLDNPDGHQKISYLVRFIRQAMNALSTNSNMSVSETNNLFGQLITNLKVVIDEGLLPGTFAFLGPQEQAFVTQTLLKQVSSSTPQVEGQPNGQLPNLYPGQSAQG